MIERYDGRTYDVVRPLALVYGVFGNALGSVLITLGNTKVLCSVMVQDGVPQFLRGTGTGWLTAEYALLPASTEDRSIRDGSSWKKNNRAIEISRLIGRSLRAVVDLKSIGEKTVYIDCDVVQADGGTRTAAITGSYYAIKHAIARSALAQKTVLPYSFLKEQVGAVSVGWHQGNALLDIDCQEDVSIDADFNFVMTGSGAIVEMQGCVEKTTGIPWEAVDTMRKLATKGIAEMHRVLETVSLTV